MGQDIRELLKQGYQIPSGDIREGHQQRFMARLEEEIPIKPPPPPFDTRWTKMKVAATIVLILSVSYITFYSLETNITKDTQQVVSVEGLPTKNAALLRAKKASQLATISPEYKEAENYFLTSIKFELSQITIDDTNRELVESFMKRLENLHKEYDNLNKELIAVGPNMQSVEAMMQNLRLRLSLLNRLKSKLAELEKIAHEDYTDIQV